MLDETKMNVVKTKKDPMLMERRNRVSVEGRQARQQGIKENPYGGLPRTPYTAFDIMAWNLGYIENG